MRQIGKLPGSYCISGQRTQAVKVYSNTYSLVDAQVRTGEASPENHTGLCTCMHLLYTCISLCANVSLFTPTGIIQVRD